VLDEPGALAAINLRLPFQKGGTVINEWHDVLQEVQFLIVMCHSEMSLIPNTSGLNAMEMLGGPLRACPRDAIFLSRV
jgi:hypothetical protein